MKSLAYNVVISFPILSYKLNIEHRLFQGKGEWLDKRHERGGRSGKRDHIYGFDF